MKRSDAIKSTSKYLAHADLQGKAQTYTINGAGMEDVSGTEVLVIGFKEITKGMIIKVTNWNSIEDLHGKDTDDWMGKKISVFPTTCDYQGNRVRCMRVQAADTNHSQHPEVNEDDKDEDDKE